MRSAVHDHHLKRARKHFVTKKCSVTHRRSAIAIALSRKHDRDVTVEACWFIARKYEDVQAVCHISFANRRKIIPQELLDEERRVLARVDYRIPWRTAVCAMDEMLADFVPAATQQAAVVEWILDLLLSGLLPLRTPLAWMGILASVVREHTVPVIAQAVACLVGRPLHRAIRA